MACNCGRAANGDVVVYQLHVPGAPIRTFATDGEAKIARTRSGGAGTIIRTTQPAPR